MDKSPEAFRTISEVADALDVPPHVLRFWETRFTQVKPVKRGGGRRYYRPEDVRLLRGIRGLLYDDGMTIKGVQKILREKGVRHVIGLGTLSEPEAPADAAAAAPEPAAPPPVRTPPVRTPPVRTPAAERPARPQADLFAERAAEVLIAPEPEAPATTTPEAERSAPESVHAAAEPAATAEAADRKSLKALVAELEALRAVMIADPER
jgi:DNA-binding transcriptional MerR regulator